MRWLKLPGTLSAFITHINEAIITGCLLQIEQTGKKLLSVRPKPINKIEPMKPEILTHEKISITGRSLQAGGRGRSTGWLTLLLFAGLAAPVVTNAATIWNGPLITFTQAAPYPNTGDRDQLTANVSLTRGVPSGGNGGMFNGVTESSFTKFVSPADTEWAVGSLADYATLCYSVWPSGAGAHPVFSLVCQPLVVHLISDGTYVSLQFTALPAGPGFAYI